MATRIPLAFRRRPRTHKKPIDEIKKWHIYRGDTVRCCFFSRSTSPKMNAHTYETTVEIIAGPHKGTQGEVISVVREKNKVIVENVKMTRVAANGICGWEQTHRYVKATPAAAGRSYLAPSPIHYSNVNLVDPSIGKPTRIAIRFTEEGEKVRVSKKTGTLIPKPAILKERHNPRRTETGPLDTAPEDVLERTVEDWEVTRL
ncbi:hypothetical protein PsorP6_013126 [Peronosclerospora sorghi]|uniref:Uncharacterized protein n=1 Tax=Peronosclerospora sorghi TaxID=230839 RepID=A0ACC0WJ12_9STRA|nr:hypothetical protein PsorP6_013126 [Peronosclerospora sorghi]